MDEIDKNILSLLQLDANQPLAKISGAVSLSPTPCWKRVKKLQDAGFIRKRVALVDAAAVNVPVTVMVSFSTSDNSPTFHKVVREVVLEVPEVVACYRMSGDVDYMLWLKVPDIAGYDSVYKRLISKIELHDVHSRFVLETLKETTELPLNYVAWS